MAVTLIIITHLIIFISYPDTTPLGPSYMFISIILSSMFYYLIKPSLKKTSKSFSFNIKIVMWLSLLFFTIINYPQKDNKSVLSKILKAQFPKKIDLYRGFKKIGIDAPFILTWKNK